MPDLFADRYDIQHELGRGAFGVVYLAHDVRLRSRPVALKVLHPALSTDPSVVRLFENEAGVLAGLRHDHIITVYDVGVWELRRYIVMDYVAGPSLAQVVREGGAQSPQRVRTWLRQAAEALAYAHGQGVLHRDVKSANLLLETARDRLFVSDFGLARAAEASGGSSAQSDAHLLTGTAAYRAPEVHRTGHSAASDLYSLGVVGYELLAGRRPYESEDPLSLMLLHATEQVPPLPVEVPVPLAALVNELLAKEPAQRPQSAAGVVDRLTKGWSTAPSPVGARQSTVPLPESRPLPPAPVAEGSGRSKQHRLGWLAGVISLLVVATVAVWALTGHSGQEPEAPSTSVSSESVAIEREGHVPASPSSFQTETPVLPIETVEVAPATTIPPTSTPTSTDTPVSATDTPTPLNLSQAPVAMAQPSPTPTATSTPTGTPTATPKPTPTRISTSPAPTLPSQSSGMYAQAPVPVEPNSGTSVAVEQRFSWRWEGPPLQSNERFDWRLLRSGVGEDVVDVRAITDQSLVYRFGNLPDGEYFWSVRVIRLDAEGKFQRVASPESARYLVRWTTSEPTMPPPPPTSYPTPRSREP